MRVVHKLRLATRIAPGFGSALALLAALTAMAAWKFNVVDTVLDEVFGSDWVKAPGRWTGSRPPPAPTPSAR